METNCQYIWEWDKERLYEMADFKDKTVLDVGTDSGPVIRCSCAC